MTRSSPWSGHAPAAPAGRSLLLIDIDHFKRINDAHGHQAGDECLRHTARVLSAAADRPADIIARYGGDEFAILLAETDSLGASTVAWRIRSAMAKNLVGTCYASTLSIGVATCNAEEDSSPEDLVCAADRALYSAKDKGRDRIESADFYSLVGASAHPRRNDPHKRHM